jgi:hypothetical protein
MGKSTQFRQQTNDYDDEATSTSKAAQQAAESASDDDNCFLNPTLAAFNFGNLFYCNFCGFSANNTNKILHHLFIHVFKCSSCNHFTYTKYDLMKHIYKYHRPNKELKIKRLVLEVTSNDWYFLCSENEPHNLTSAINDDNDSGACFNINSDYYRSIDTSSFKSGSHHHQQQQHTRLVQSNQLYDHNEFTGSKGGKNDSKKPATNFFLPKVQKSPEKLTQVIQSNRQYTTTTYTEVDNSQLDNSFPSTSNNSSQLKKLMSNNKDSNPTSKIVIPTIKMMNTQQTSSSSTIQSTNNNNNKQSSISTIMNSPVYTSNTNNKLMDYMESTTTSANQIPSLVSGKPKRQIKKPISIQDRMQTPKVIKKPKKCKIFF